ncbi:MAG: DNA polymerase/3'-5' exonuclease PolX [Planctomycetota bacterium]
MDNQGIADSFDELAELLEFKDENPFRVRAYRQGASAIRNLQESVAQIVTDPNRSLAELPGIGKTLAEKAETLVRSGKLPKLEQLRADVPPLLIEMSRVPGLGVKKATALLDLLKLESLEDLRAACESGTVAKQKGFGKKTAATILEGLDLAAQANERLLWLAADQLTAVITEHMESCDVISKMQWAGSYRRRRETVGDLDLLVVAGDRDAAMDHLETLPQKSQTIARGETKLSIRVNDGFQVDLRCVEPEEFGAALQYFTGSQAHNVRTRSLAKSLGLKINEYGVFRVDDDVRVAGETEADVYAAIGLPYIEPELREDRIEFEWAQNNALPNLIVLSDIRGDLHMHTTATDGKNTIREMADAAIARGLQYIAITDHSQRVRMAGGLDAESLRQQWDLIDEIREEYHGRLEILKGIECDILEAGGMDLADDVLAEADWVLASIHFGQRQSREQITDRMLGAITNKYVSCIAHPTGRLLNKRPAYDVDMEAVLQAAAEYGKRMELNASPKRLDLNDVHLAAAKRYGVPVVISTDAHRIEGMDVMRCGILQARRAGLTKDDVANTKPVDDFLKT